MIVKVAWANLMILKAFVGFCPSLFWDDLLILFLPDAKHQPVTHPDLA